MRRISVVTTALAVAVFFAFSYSVCVAYDLAVPDDYRMYPAWADLFPGFDWIGWGSFFIGLGESFAYGIYVGAAVAFVYRLAILPARSTSEAPASAVPPAEG